MKSITKFIFFILCSGITSLIFAQPDFTKDLINLFSSYKNQNLQEKLYLHIDRKSYLVGETIWFKIYCVEGSTNKPLDISKVVYIELIDNESKIALQTKVDLSGGFGNGSIFLTSSINSGHFTLRAYTRWMKNFDADFFFQQPITIINTFRNLGLVSVKDTSSYDIQFFPEGGNLVQGIQSKVAFKASKNGKSFDANGFIINQKKDTIAKFKFSRFGLGSFAFNSQSNAEYKVFVKDGKKLISAKLPIIHESGIVMQLEDLDTTQLKINVYSSSKTDEPILLFAHTRNVVKYAGSAVLQNGSTSFKINKSVLGDGISHFTIFNANKMPVCERLYFKFPKQKIDLEATTDKTVYANREKINLTIASSAFKNLRESASLSLAVFQSDSLSNLAKPNIINYLLLNSDLKGKVESPDFYTSGNGIENAKAIDNLMLTHGWRRFVWENILSNKNSNHPFFPEFRGHVITAKVIDSLTGNLAENVETYLSALGKTIKFYNSKSDKNGRLLFETNELYGQKEIVIQPNSLSGRIYKVELHTPFSDKFSSNQLPVFDLSDKLSNHIQSKSIEMQSQNIFFGGKLSKNQLRVDSTPFYGRGDESYRLDDYTRFKTMEDVIREYVKGVSLTKRKDKYRFSVTDERNKGFMPENPLVLLDGVMVSDIDSIMVLNPLKIKHIDIMTQKYFYGSNIYNGIVSLTTYEGDMAGYPPERNWTIVDYDGLQMNKEFYSPTYETRDEIESRVPDFRNLLLWNPNIQPDKNGDIKLEFYASDKIGKFRGEIQGISASGRLISQSFEFEVKKESAK